MKYLSLITKEITKRIKTLCKMGFNPQEAAEASALEAIPPDLDGARAPSQVLSGRLSLIRRSSVGGLRIDEQKMRR